MPVFAAFVLLCAATPAAYAQSITGDLVVGVTDPSGLAATGAALRLIEVDTNIEQQAKTDELGTYMFRQLKPGGYRLEVAAGGFQKTVVNNISIQVGQRARVDVKLAVSQLSETVTVSAANETLLNAESAAIGQVMENKPMVELPLNGRNFIQLAQLSAGAAPVGIGTSPASGWTGRSDTTLSIAGGRESNNSFLINGIESRNPRFGNAGMRPSIDAIQEFKIQRSTFGAEFGRSAAIINTTLKSGTNGLHGSVFEFLRNRNLDANDYFLNRTDRGRAPLVQNNYGTAVGGPVVLPKIYNGRNRTFWFFNYEAMRQRGSSQSSRLEPSAAQYQGNLADDSAGTGLFPTSSAFCQTNPGSPKCVDVIDPQTGAPFPGNVIPTNRLDPITQLAVQYSAVPNVAVAPNQPSFPLYNVVGTPSQINDFDQYNTRIDHQLSSADQLFGTFSYSEETKNLKSLRPYGGESYPLGNRLVTITHIHTFSPTILNEFRFGYNRSKTYTLAETAFGKDYARDVFHLKNTSDLPIVFGVPYFGFSGFGGIGSMSEAIGALDDNYQFTDNLSMIRGRHNFRAGFQISRELYAQITNFSGLPNFSFDGRYTGLQANGIGIADFLLGYPSSASGAIGDSLQNLRTTFWSGYLQDDFRITSNFTLNYGLRYEFARSPYEKDNKSLFFSPELGQIVLAGKGVRPDIVDPDYNNFAPRLGFSWRPSFLSNFVVRGGAGIYYSTDNSNEEQFKGQGPPFFQSQTIDGDPLKPNLFMSDMLPSFETSPNLNPFSFDRLNRTPYLSQWSFGIQQSFHSDYLFELEYTGSTGQKLGQRRNLNIARLDPTGTTPIVDRKPFPDFGFILLTYNGGWSSYNAMTAKLEKRWSKGLWFLGSYTWQKSLDLGSTDEFSMLSTEYKKWDRGRSSFDVPHRFVGSWVYELPIGRGRRLLSNMSPVADAFLGGWQINGILTFARGQYLSPYLGTDWLFIGSFTTSQPNIIGDPAAGRSTPDHYLNPAAFDFPRDAQGNLTRVPGNAGRNTIEQPGLNNWDLGVFKNFRMGDRLTTQFRWETFNTWNHTQFGSADMDTLSPNFGAINSLRVGARRMQFGLRVMF